MRYRPLGDSGIEISEIGFGTWGIGGVHGGAVGYGPTNDDDSIEALRTAFDQGVTFYDTAALYGYGHSETLLGRAFKGHRDQVVIATKAGFLNFEGEQDFSVAGIRASLEDSLGRLQTDYADLFQLHSPSLDELEEDNALLRLLEDLQKEGKIRAAGIAVRSPEEGLRAIELFPFKSVQVNYNLADQRAVDTGLFDVCRDKGAGIIVRTPLCFGFLTGKYSAKDDYDEKDHRSGWSAEQVEKWAKAFHLFAEPFREREPQTSAQIALRFCLSHESVTSAIPGMLNPEQVLENIQASAMGSLAREDLERLKEIYGKHTFFVTRRG